MFGEVKVRRLRRWLAEGLCPDVTVTAATPGESCAHHHDPELMLQRLWKAAPQSPIKLSKVLDEFDGCPGCLAVVLIHAVYTHVGNAQDRGPQGVAALPPSCSCGISPELLATAVTNALDANDNEQLRVMLRQILDCPACCFETIVAIGMQKVQILDGLETTLRPALDQELQTIFGGER